MISDVTESTAIVMLLDVDEVIGVMIVGVLPVGFEEAFNTCGAGDGHGRKEELGNNED